MTSILPAATLKRPDHFPGFEAGTEYDCRFLPAGRTCAELAEYASAYMLRRAETASWNQAIKAREDFEAAHPLWWRKTAGRNSNAWKPRRCRRSDPAPPGEDRRSDGLAEKIQEIYAVRGRFS